LNALEWEGKGRVPAASAVFSNCSQAFQPPRHRFRQLHLRQGTAFLVPTPPFGDVEAPALLRPENPTALLPARQVFGRRPIEVPHPAGHDDPCLFSFPHELRELVEMEVICA